MHKHVILKKKVLHHHIFSHRHNANSAYFQEVPLQDRNGIFFYFFFVTYTLMFLLASDKTEDGWLVGRFGFNGPLRQYFSLYRAVSQRKGERGEKG